MDFQFVLCYIYFPPIVIATQLHEDEFRNLNDIVGLSACCQMRNPSALYTDTRRQNIIIIIKECP